MEYKSVFNIIGPVMVGPSSSHTAGALGIALYGRERFGRVPERVDIVLYESFAKTYKGHGTDVALVSGVLGMEADDMRIRNAFEIAKSEGLEVNFIISDEMAPHPNTVKLTFISGDDKFEVVGISIGGGSFKVLTENGRGV